MRSQPGSFMPVMGNERADLAAASALSLPGILEEKGLEDLGHEPAECRPR